jgi:hypothetical protein
LGLLGPGGRGISLRLSGGCFGLGGGRFRFGGGRGGFCFGLSGGGVSVRSVVSVVAARGCDQPEHREHDDYPSQSFRHCQLSLLGYGPD